MIQKDKVSILSVDKEEDYMYHYKDKEIAATSIRILEVSFVLFKAKKVKVAF